MAFNRAVCDERHKNIDGEIKRIDSQVEHMETEIANMGAKLGDFAVVVGKMDTRITIYTGAAAFVASILAALVMRFLHLG